MGFFAHNTYKQTLSVNEKTKDYHLSGGIALSFSHRA
jgi:hypothetical protein